jgi:hypothetical protein
MCVCVCILNLALPTEMNGYIMNTFFLTYEGLSLFLRGSTTNIHIFLFFDRKILMKNKMALIASLK